MRSGTFLNGRGKIVFNLSMIVLSVGLVAGVQSLRNSTPNHAGSILVPVAMAGEASPSPSPSASPTPAPSPSPTPAPIGCSPGYFKNHQSAWVGTCCDNEGQRSCSELLSALTCKGADATCGRSAAAAYLNACTGCTE